MKKTNLTGSIVIILVLSVVSIISIISSNIKPSYVYAYDPNYLTANPGTIYGSSISPNLVNNFDTIHSPWDMKYPPVGSERDLYAWRGGPDIPGSPTPGISPIGPGMDLNQAYVDFGSNYARVTWTGNISGSSQYIHLTNYANTLPNKAGQNLENCGCSGLTITPAGGYNAMVAMPGSMTQVAGDWGCYGFLRFYMYLNTQINNGAAASYVEQNVSLYDGNVTVTSMPVVLDVQGQLTNEHFTRHCSMGLNYFANYYDITSGRYFSVSNIADVIINAPIADYKDWPTVAPLGFTTDYKSILVYYNQLTLGAKSQLPLYDSPSGITIQTAYNGVNPIGAFISWQPFGSALPNVPVTGYHVYRKLAPGDGSPDATNPEEPYVSVGIVSTLDPSTQLCITDTAVAGGQVYCYKILTCNMGPNPTPIITDFGYEDRLNTVNATYNEPLLNDQDTNVARVCGYINPMPPTPTFTASPTGTPCLSCGTPTPTPTQTSIPDLSNAHVYPNPYNPNATPGPSNTGGSGRFYVDNTPDGTKIFIYSMDGSLVKEGDFKSATGRFTWDGRNKNGSKVVSGLYYLVLQAPDKTTRVFRVIVCYKCDPVYHPQP